MPGEARPRRRPPLGQRSASDAAPLSLGDLPAALGKRPPHLVRSVELSGGASATVAVDLLVGGRAVGGIRLLEGPSPVTVEVLARTMTWKMALAGLPTGGAKAIVSVPPDATVGQRAQALAELAAEVRDLVGSRTWMPAPDLGVPPGAAAWFTDVASDGQQVPRASWWTSGASTARSLVASTAWALRRQGCALGGATVTVVGLGAVGSAAVGQLHAAGARIAGVAARAGAWFEPGGWAPGDLGIDGPIDGRAPEGSLADLLAEPVDAVLLAGPDLLLEDLAPGSIRTPLLVPATNVPLRPSTGEALAAEGITLLPPPITSWGGALGGGLETLHVPAPVAARVIALRTRRALDQLVRSVADAHGTERQLWVEAAVRAEVRATELDARYATRRSRRLLRLARRRTDH